MAVVAREAEVGECPLFAQTGHSGSQPGRMRLGNDAGAARREERIAVLSFVAGNFGGIGRDLLIGAVPPAALTDGRYLLVSVLAGLITFFSYAGVDRLRSPVLLGIVSGRRFVDGRGDGDVGPRLSGPRHRRSTPSAPRTMAPRLRRHRPPRPPCLASIQPKPFRRIRRRLFG